MRPVPDGTRTVVFADDEQHLRELVQATLEGPEYRILLAKDGREVLDLVDSEDVDLVIIDWMMPRMTGIEVVRELASRTTAPPAMMLTAKGAQRDISLAVAAGARYHLVKPFSPLELLERVERILFATPPA